MRDPADSAERTKPLGDDFAMPIDDRYFEDYREGAVYQYGYLAMSEAEIRSSTLPGRSTLSRSTSIPSSPPADRSTG